MPSRWRAAGSVCERQRLCAGAEGLGSATTSQLHGALHMPKADVTMAALHCPPPWYEDVRAPLQRATRGFQNPRAVGEPCAPTESRASPIRTADHVWKSFGPPPRFSVGHTDMMQATKTAPPVQPAVQTARPVPVSNRSGSRRAVQQTLVDTALSGAAACLILTVRRPKPAMFEVQRLRT